MKKNAPRYIAAASLIVILAAAFASVSYANSAEPPALVIILANAPEDASVAIVGSSGAVAGQKSVAAWESYYAFYSREIGVGDEVALRVSGSGITSGSYDVRIEKEYFTGYNSIITLDFKTRAVTPGKLLSRSIMLITLRVLLTLIIESLVFLLFGFRQKRSWLIFLIINIITQAALNICLNNEISAYSPYPIILLVFLEFFVFLAETIAFPVLIKERGVARRIFFPITANFASLILGGYLITLLPV